MAEMSGPPSPHRPHRATRATRAARAARATRAAPIAEPISAPQDERTQRFLRRIMNAGRL
jgi:hypothetical protein